MHVTNIPRTTHKKTFVVACVRGHMRVAHIFPHRQFPHNANAQIARNVLRTLKCTPAFALVGGL